MKFQIPLIPVLTRTATVDELATALSECRKPFLKKLANVLKEAAGEDQDAKSLDRDERIGYIMTKATENMKAVLDAFIEIAENRNKILSGLNLGFAILKQKVKEELNKFLAEGKSAEEAFDLAWENAVDELEEEAAA